MRSQEFEEQLNFANYPELEKAYIETRDFFENGCCNLSPEEVHNQHPAFCYLDKFVMIKFPTYKVRVIDDNVSIEELNKQLLGLGMLYIYHETDTVIYPTMQRVNSIAIHCLELSLLDNRTLVEKIEEKLSTLGCHFERCVAFGLYSVPIEVKDNKIYKIS